MAGLFGGFFGKKSQEAVAKAPKTPKIEDGFYLDGDDARSLGDGKRFVDMEPVKKSFPKIFGVEQAKVSTSKITIETKQVSSTTVSSALTGFPLSSEVLQRRRADSTLDMYRNLARDIKKS